MQLIHSHLAFATLPLPILSIAFLKHAASSRPSASPSGSPKCLRFGHWLTLCTLNIHLLTYLLKRLLKVQCFEVIQLFPDYFQLFAYAVTVCSVTGTAAAAAAVAACTNMPLVPIYRKYFVVVSPALKIVQNSQMSLCDILQRIL